MKLNIDTLREVVIENDSLTLGDSEEGVPDNVVVVRDLQDADPVAVAEVFTIAHDAGVVFGPFDAYTDGGSIVFYE